MDGPRLIGHSHELVQIPLQASSAPTSTPYQYNTSLASEDVAIIGGQFNMLDGEFLSLVDPR